MWSVNHNVECYVNVERSGGPTSNGRSIEELFLEDYLLFIDYVLKLFLYKTHKLLLKKCAYKSLFVF